MTTERELLELAAKAVGYCTNHPWNAERLTLSPPVAALMIPDVSTGWDPLSDDGHALRLAVKLGIFSTTEQFLTFQSFYSDEIRRDGKPTAATRRAIVTIAAEIGKRMKYREASGHA